MRDRNTKWALVVILAAVVAAMTTITMFFLRARAKKRAITAYDDSLDYDYDDCCCGDVEDEDIDEDTVDKEDADSDHPVQIPLAKPEENPPAAEE